MSHTVSVISNRITVVDPTGSCWSEIADFEPIFARIASDVTPSEKVQLTLIGSPVRSFQ